MANKHKVIITYPVTKMLMKPIWLNDEDLDKFENGSGYERAEIIFDNLDRRGTAL